MSDIKFHECGDKMFRIGNYVYSNESLERAPAKNCIERSRYNRTTGKWESYNPHKEGPHAR